MNLGSPDITGGPGRSEVRPDKFGVNGIRYPSGYPGVGDRKSNQRDQDEDRHRK